MERPTSKDWNFEADCENSEITNTCYGIAFHSSNEGVILFFGGHENLSGFKCSGNETFCSKLGFSQYDTENQFYVEP